LLQLLVIPVIVGLVLGLLAGGRPGNLLQLHVVGTWLLWLAFALQVVRYFDLPGASTLLGGANGLRAALIVLGLGLVWIALNLVRGEPRLRLGLALLAVGLLGNLVVMAANDGMPFSTDAARTAGFSAHEISVNDVGDYTPLDGSTRLPWLADRIPIEPLHRVASIGDLFLVAGVGLVIATGMTPRRHRLQEIIT
jgi:hypothetical protein